MSLQNIILETLPLLILSGFAAWVYFAYRHWKIEFFRLETSLQHERYSNRLVSDFMHAVADSVDEKGHAQEISKKIIFNSVMHAAIRGTRAMSVCLFSVAENGEFRPIASTGLFPLLEKSSVSAKNLLRSELIRAHFAGTSYSPENPIFKKMIRAGKAVVLNEFSPAHQSGTPTASDLPARPRSLIAAPVYSAGTLSGAILIANPRHGATFSDSEIKLGDALAQQFGMALQMRNLLAVQTEKEHLDSELGIAASVQKLLLPQYIPQAHSLDIATIYKPAQKIGGDLYDVFDMGGGRIAAIVADVAGHGVSSALLMAICRTNFQHIARNSVNAADLLRRLNHAMMRSFSRGKFITITCAFLDTQRHTLSLARGGHEPPLLCRTHNVPEFEFLESKGLAIGISKPEIFDATITEISRPFELGDVLVLYTDGLTEACNPAGEEFGQARLAAAVNGARHAPADEINRAVLNDLESFTGTSVFADDLTIVAIKSV